MASSFTGQHSLEKPGIGEQAGTWGLSLNTNLDKIDGALSRVFTFTEAQMNTNPTITTSQSAVASFDAAAYFFSGTLAGNRTVTFPSSKQGTWVVDIANVTFGSNKLIMKVNGETNGVTITSATDPSLIIYSNGTSIRRIGDDFNPYITGEIRMWAPSGGFTSSAQLPTGWHICNGNNSTPDLRNQFIRGTANHITYVAETKTGGAVTASISLGSLAAVGNTQSTVLTENQIPSHTHFVAASETAVRVVPSNLGELTAMVRYGSGSAGDEAYSLTAATKAADVGLSSETGGGSGHVHAVSINIDAGSAVVSTVPPFYRVIYIMYTGI